MHQSGVAQAQFGLIAFLPHQVGSIGLKALYLTRSGKLESLFGAGMRFHLWHDLTAFPVILKIGWQR
jgi:hypothetical protein